MRWNVPNMLPICPLGCSWDEMFPTCFFRLFMMWDEHQSPLGCSRSDDMCITYSFWLLTWDAKTCYLYVGHKIKCANHALLGYSWCEMCKRCSFELFIRCYVQDQHSCSFRLFMMWYVQRMLLWAVHKESSLSCSWCDLCKRCCFELFMDMQTMLP